MKPCPSGACRAFAEAELRDHVPVLRELHDVRVAAAVPADPDVALVVDEDPVVRLRPLVALVVLTGFAAPRLHDMAVLVEREDRRRADAAIPRRRILLGSRLAPGERGRTPVDHPDDVLVVHPDADRIPEKPVLGKRLRPERIHLEERCLHLGGHRSLETGLSHP